MGNTMQATKYEHGHNCTHKNSLIWMKMIVMVMTVLKSGTLLIRQLPKTYNNGFL